MIFTYLKKKFGKKDKEVSVTEQFYTPLRIALHSTLELQTVDMIVLQSVLNPSFVLPSGPLEVLAIGSFTMDGTPIHQVYVKDFAGEEFVLQIVEGKNYRTQEPTVDELTLYKQIVTLEPETDAELQRYLGDIGFDEIEVEEITYSRYWGDAYTEKVDFRKFEEKVITPSGPEQFTDEYLLYGREIDSPIRGECVTEYLLVGIEEGTHSAQIMMQVGLKINPTDITVQ